MGLLEKEFVKDFYRTFDYHGYKVVRVESPLTESGIPDTMVITEKGLQLTEFKVINQNWYKGGVARESFTCPWRPAQIAFQNELLLASAFTVKVVTMVKFRDMIVKIYPIAGFISDKKVTRDKFSIQVFKDMEKVYLNWRGL